LSSPYFNSSTEKKEKQQKCNTIASQGYTFVWKKKRLSCTLIRKAEAEKLRESRQNQKCICIMKTKEQEMVLQGLQEINAFEKNDVEGGSLANFSIVCCIDIPPISSLMLV
jgi:hypothetical protein